MFWRKRRDLYASYTTAPKMKNDWIQHVAFGYLKIERRRNVISVARSIKGKEATLDHLRHVLLILITLLKLLKFYSAQ